MQEEVNQKTVALSIRTTKLTGKVLAAALGKVARALQKHHRKALTPQGRQSVKKLMNHYGGKSAMPYVGAPKDFDRIAKEFHVDYALITIPKYMRMLSLFLRNLCNQRVKLQKENRGFVLSLVSTLRRKYMWIAKRKSFRLF